MEEASAMKFQLAWRRKKVCDSGLEYKPVKAHTQARDRMQALREEKQRKMEEAAALMFQSAWRCRKVLKICSPSRRTALKRALNVGAHQD
jgi:uncharacterized protein (DUF2132 family)